MTLCNTKAIEFTRCKSRKIHLNVDVCQKISLANMYQLDHIGRTLPRGWKKFYDVP